MKKVITVLMAMILVVGFSVNLYASDFAVSDYTNPFTGNAYMENSFCGNGTIIIILSHERSIVWREYTTDDFPELELESVYTLEPVDDFDGRINNKEYRGFVHITLNDKSNKAVIEAIDLLYKRNENVFDLNDPSLCGDIYMAVPMSKTYYDKPEVSLPLEEISIGDVNGDFACNLSDVSLILKYIAKWDNISIVTRAADVNEDGVISLLDASLLLKQIAGWKKNV